MRSPAEDPRPGDSLLWNEHWRIRVTERDGDRVSYTAGVKGQGKPKNKSQALHQWQGWAGQAKVVRRGSGKAECVVTAFAAGSCGDCGQYQTKGVHILGVRLFCSEHCPAEKHS